jgi:hypothetical protein
MELNDKVYCNVCGANNEDPTKVFVQAVFGDNPVHICTSCIPSVIHGGSEVVNTNEELSSKING